MEAKRNSFAVETDPAVKVSVIVPIYKVETYMEACAVSLMEQTMTDGIEFIFVDDCSPDRSIDILRDVMARYPQRAKQVRIIRQERNGGVALARLNATEVSRGEYIIHCDPDDLPDRDMYGRMYAKAVADKADAVISGYYVVNSDGCNSVTPDMPDDPMAVVQNVIDGALHNALWNKLISRRMYEAVDVWYVPGMNLFEDVSLVPRLLSRARRIAFVPEPLYRYNQLNVGSYTALWNDAYVSQIVNAIGVVVDFFKDDSRVQLNTIKGRLKLMLSIKSPELFGRKYVDIYPEANGSILGLQGFFMLDKLACRCRVAHIPVLPRFFRFLRDAKRSLGRIVRR